MRHGVSDFFQFNVESVRLNQYTDGDLHGPMLESAWRSYLEQQADLQPSKKAFAYMVLATYG